LVKRSSTSSESIISAYKYEVPYEDNFDNIFKSISTLLPEYLGNLYIACGTTLSYYFHTNASINLPVNDVDLFFYV